MADVILTPCNVACTISISLSYTILSRRSRQRERLSASVPLSVCLSVCLSVAKRQKRLFYQKFSNLELTCLLTTYGKSHISFSKNPLLDP